MGLIVPGSPEFMWRLDTHGGRPASPQGATLTPGNNTKGSWVELIDGALVTYDVWGIEIAISNVALASAARDVIVDIGIDPTAGTSYSVLIPDLSGANAGPLSTSGGNWYFFPLHIPAGSSIAARASVNNATVGTANVKAILYGRPKHPEVARKGTVVEAIGITAASSAGTTVTSGTTSEGSWTSLGTVTRQAWWWQLGFFRNDASAVTNLMYFIDLSAGSAGGDIMLIEDQVTIGSTTSETSATRSPLGLSARTVPAGSTVYGRMQCSTTADTGLSLAAYALS